MGCLFPARAWFGPATAGLLALSAAAPASATIVNYRFEFFELPTLFFGIDGSISGNFTFGNAGGFIDATGEGYLIPAGTVLCGVTFAGGGPLSYPPCGTHLLLAAEDGDTVAFTVLREPDSLQSVTYNFTFAPGSFTSFGEHLALDEGVYARLLVSRFDNPPPPPPPGIPEPMSWALMIAGFGLVGAAIRLRVRNFAPASAAA